MADLVLNRLRLKGLRRKKHGEHQSALFSRLGPNKPLVDGGFNCTIWTRQSGTHLLDWAAEEDELRTSFLEDKDEEEEEEEVDFEGRKIEQWEALDKFNLNERHKGFIYVWYCKHLSSQMNQKNKWFPRIFVLYIWKLNHNVNCPVLIHVMRATFNLVP